MLITCTGYLRSFLQKAVIPACLLAFFCGSAYAQESILKKDTTTIQLNPLLLSSFKKPLKLNPGFNEYIKPSKHELMRWPNFPLTAAQIEERDKKNNRPIGEQIANDILDSYIKGIINGKNKKPVASVPRF